MRFVMHVSLPVEKFNDAVRDGSVGAKIESILADAKPEGVYFCAQGGQRGAYIIVDMKSTSEMPRLAEPWFLNFNAAVEFMPTMTPADLAASGIETLAKKWK